MRPSINQLDQRCSTRTYQPQQVLRWNERLFVTHYQSVRFIGYKKTTARSLRRDGYNEMGLATTTTSGFGVEAAAPRGRSIVDNWMPSMLVKLRCDWPKISSLRLLLLLLQLKKSAFGVVTSYIIHSDILNFDKR